MIAARQIAFGKAAGAAKPYKARLEYLESTGTQYIVTDYVPNDNSVVEMDVQSTDNSVMLNGVYSVNARFNFGISTEYKNPWFAGIGSSNIDAKITSDTSRHLLILSAPEKTYNVSGVGVFSVGSGSVNGNTYKFEFFARNQAGGTGSNKSKMRLFGLVIKELNVIIHSFIPVLDNADTPCMYDEVSGEFFYNAGTGEFIAGPEITEE